MSSDLKGIRVAILATDGVEQDELTEPRKFLQQLGAETELLSPKNGKIQAMQHHEKGETIEVDRPLNGAESREYDAVLLPGGALNADTLRMSEEARRFVREADREGKPIAVICHAPWLLASAGLLRGRTLTSFRTIQDDLRNAGADWHDEEVVRDQNWITSRQPSDIPAFNRAFAELLTEVRNRKAA
jgi:protease I